MAYVKVKSFYLKNKSLDNKVLLSNRIKIDTNYKGGEYDKEF